MGSGISAIGSSNEVSNEGPERLLRGSMGSGNFGITLRVCFLLLSCASPLASANYPDNNPVDNSMGNVMAPIRPLSPEPSSSGTSDLKSWCAELGKTIIALKWKIEPCGNIPWQIGGSSAQGRPLVYADFGDKNAENTTLVLATVHGDEVTPLYLGIQLAHWLIENRGLVDKRRVIVAPLVNPDGFFRTPRTRMNARGVDINRNFRTQDWQKRALAAWKRRFKKDPRRFPGAEPRSESETLFQEDLIKKMKPQKILSIHSPLNHLDYDGPSPLSLSRFSTEYTQICEKLKRSLKAKSSGYYPGSLGNYAGRELGIPTLTLELPTAKPEKAADYWKKFTHGIWTMIHFTVPSFATGKSTPKIGG